MIGLRYIILLYNVYNYLLSFDEYFVLPSSLLNLYYVFKKLILIHRDWPKMLIIKLLYVLGSQDTLGRYICSSFVWNFWLENDQKLYLIESSPKYKIMNPLESTSS